jgi:hypothetical protein
MDIAPPRMRIIMAPEIYIADVDRAEVVKQRTIVRLTLRAQPGGPCVLVLPTEFLDRFAYTLQTISSSLTQLEPGKPPRPRERVRAAFMGATEVTLGRTEDGRTTLRIDTVQGLTPHFLLSDELAERLHDLLAAHLGQANVNEKSARRSIQ